MTKKGPGMRNGSRGSRRSVSLNGECYQLLLDHCKELGLSVASFVQAAAIEKLRSHGVEVPDHIPDQVEALAPGQRRKMVERQRNARRASAAERQAEIDAIARDHFTF